MVDFNFNRRKRRSTSHRHRKVCEAIEIVLSRQTRWLDTKAVAKLVQLEIDLTTTREVRLKLHALLRDGKVHRCRHGRGYSWRWRP